MSEQEMNLPDPGTGRFWRIEADSVGYLTLSLMREAQTFAHEDTVISTSNMVMPMSATARTFENLAEEMLVKEEKTSAFVGDYKFEETN